MTATNPSGTQAVPLNVYSDAACSARTLLLSLERYCNGIVKTHLQNVAIAAAMNVDRLVAWFDRRPRAQTRTTRFVALMPHQAIGPG
jgi:hypothetical protein